LAYSLILIFWSVSNAQKTSSEIPKDYKLVWADEFNGHGSPDPEFWSFEKGFVRNEELQWYQEDNANLKNGYLEIQGKRKKFPNPEYDSLRKNWNKNQKFIEYTSSSIHTRGKKSFKYGILEVKAKIDTSSGMWPAIWTLGIEKGWPANGEIDIMEFYRIKNKPFILANFAWKGEIENVKWNSEKILFSEFTKNDPIWIDNFHVSKMYWTKDYIQIYLDNELLNEIDLSKTTNPGGFNPFQQPHYILLNLAIGSNGGNPEKTKFPNSYIIDYVRLYQKE